MKHCQILLGVALALALNAPADAALFFDDLDTAGSAANYTQVGTGTHDVVFGYDYGAMGIPSAPKTTDGSRTGARLRANIGDTGVVSAVTLHTIEQFTGAYTVKFDLWINANGPFPVGQLIQGGTGSTEFFTAGVGGDGSTVNYGGTGPTGSGGWTAVNGEGGSGIDYRMHKTTVLQAPSSGQYAAGTVDSPTADNSRNANDPYYAGFGSIDVSNLPVQGADQGGYAQQNGVVKPGVLGFEWHEVELQVDPTGGTGGTPSVAWYIGGLRIGTFDAGVTTAFATDGSVTLGYYDPFAGLSDNLDLSFAVVDNLTVIPEPSSLTLLLTMGLGLVAARRR